MRQSVRICRVFGIDVNVHFSLIFILAILVYVFYVNPPPFGFSNLPPTTRLSLSILMSLALFLSILLHELGHSLVAIRFGSRVRGIVLFIFGGVALIENIPKEPKKEFSMALAGPLTSFVIALISFALLSLNKQFFFLLGYLNMVLGLFNLFPAFPMDGGRILRSLLASKMGFVKATRLSAEVGKFLAVLMAVFGIFVGNIWLILIALFVYIGANEEERLVTVEGLLGRFKVKDIMTPDPVYVTPDTTVRDVIKLMLERKHLGYPVVEDGRLIGIVTLKDVVNADEDARVRDVMSTDLITVSPDDDALKALRFMSERGIGRIPVVDDGRLVGIVSRSDIVKIVEILEAVEIRAHEVGAHTTA